MSEMNHPTEMCRRFAQRYDAMTLGALPQAEATMLREHLATCRHCQDWQTVNESAEAMLRQGIDRHAHQAQLLTKGEIMRLTQTPLPIHEKPRLRYLPQIAVAAALTLVVVSIIATRVGLIPNSVKQQRASSSDFLTIVTNAGPGQVTLNNHAVESPSPTTIYRLLAGKNTVTYQVSPFATKSCELSVPPAKTDTCQASNSHVSNVYDVVFKFVFADLPEPNRTQTTTRLQAALSQAIAAQTTTVRVGDLYQTGIDKTTNLPTYASAKEPLTASLVGSAGQNILDQCSATPTCTLVIGDSGSQSCYSTQECTLINGGGGPQPVWLLRLPMTFFHYRLGTSNGQVVSEITPQQTQGIPETVDIPLIWSQQTWQFYDYSTYGVAQDAQSILGSQIAILPTDAAQAFLSYVAPRSSRSTVSVSKEGIIWTVTLLDSKGGLTTNTGIFLYRFGVLYAADAPARAIAPTLPVASSALIAYVQSHS